MKSDDVPLPEIALLDAIKLTMSYFKTNQIKSTDRKPAQALWNFDSKSEKWCWQLSWLTSQEMHDFHRSSGKYTGKQLIATVTDDGRVDHVFSE